MAGKLCMSSIGRIAQYMAENLPPEVIQPALDAMVGAIINAEGEEGQAKFIEVLADLEAWDALSALTGNKLVFVPFGDMLANK